jgi:hypothetical protein
MVYLMWAIFLVLVSFIAIKHTDIVDKQEDNI